MAHHLNIPFKLRRAILICWAATIFISIVAYLTSPASFTPEGITAFFTKHRDGVLVVFALSSMFRGFTLIPSSPLVIAGTVLFPEQPLLVLSVSIFGIIISSSAIYWLSDILGFADHFERRKPYKVKVIRRRLEHPTGLLFVTLWAFFPFVPTDAVCYVAGSMRMNFVKFIFAIFAGESILCSIYVFVGSHLLTAI